MPFLLRRTSWLPPLILGTAVAKRSLCTLTQPMLPALASRSHSVPLSQGFMDAVVLEPRWHIPMCSLKVQEKLIPPRGTLSEWERVWWIYASSHWFFASERLSIFSLKVFPSKIEPQRPSVESRFLLQVFFSHVPKGSALKLSTCKSLPQILLYRYSR